MKSLHRGPTPKATGPDQYWAMDVVHDQLGEGRRFRGLTGIDKSGLESALLEVGFVLTGLSVASAFERLARSRPMPHAITVINGTEFTSKALDDCKWRNGVQLKFFRPGNSTEDGMIETFNGRLSDECLNAHVFASITDAQQKISAWKRDYNEHRPHSVLGHLTPREFIEESQDNPSRATRL